MVRTYKKEKSDIATLPELKEFDFTHLEITDLVFLNASRKSRSQRSLNSVSSSALCQKRTFTATHNANFQGVDRHVLN